MITRLQLLRNIGQFDNVSTPMRSPEPVDLGLHRELARQDDPRNDRSLSGGLRRAQRPFATACGSSKTLSTCSAIWLDDLRPPRLAV